MARFGILAIAALVLAACANAPMGQSPPVASAPIAISPDQDFLNRAATGTGNEIELGRLAQQRGLSPSVRAFGAHLATEHTRANAAVMALAQRLNLVPSTATADLRGLAALPGPDFDRQFIADQVKNQREALGLFESSAQAGQDPRVRRFAREWIPVLRRDLSRAEQIAVGVGALASLR